MSDAPDPPVVARRVVVSGHVQGVFFRDSTRREAERRGVAGWVTNRPDGTVEAALEGPSQEVDAVIALCRVGPHGARVERVDVRDVAVEGLRGFEVR